MVRLTRVRCLDSYQASRMYNAFARVMFELGYNCKDAHTIWKSTFIFNIDDYDGYYGL